MPLTCPVLLMYGTTSTCAASNLPRNCVAVGCPVSARSTKSWSCILALGSPLRSAFSYSPRVGAARSTSRLGFTRSRPYRISTSRMTFSARCLLSHSLTTCPSKSTREARM